LLKLANVYLHDMKRKNYDILPEECEEDYMVWFW